MTGERRNTRENDIADPAVSATYRALAAERTPATLNETVLRDATIAAGSGYSRAITWLRPMAWAATVALCFAIVIEITQISSQVPGEPGPSSGRSEAAIPDDGPPGLPVDLSMPQESGDPKLRGPGSAGTSPMPVRSETAGASGKKSNSSVAAAFHVDDAPILDKAAAEARRFDMPEKSAAKARQVDSPASATTEARRRDTQSKAAAKAPMPDMRDEADGVAVASDAQTDVVEPLIAARPCEGAVRSAPETWLACIASLREAGREAEAEEQQRAFVAAFPDVEVPWKTE